MRNAKAPLGFAADVLLPDLDTGDLVLWAGDGNLSRFIQFGTNSTWSHVGLVVKLPGNLLMLWESTIEESFSGVRLTPLKPQLYGHVAVRRLNGVERSPELLNAFLQIRQELDGRPFEQSWLEFIRAGYDGPFGQNTRDISSLFCAELVAETLQQLGILGTEQPSNEFTPRDFSDEAATPLPLLKGQYGPECLVLPAAATARIAAIKPCVRPYPYGRTLFALPAGTSR